MLIHRRCDKTNEESQREVSRRRALGDVLTRDDVGTEKDAKLVERYEIEARVIKEHPDYMNLLEHHCDEAVVNHKITWEAEDLGDIREVMRKFEIQTFGNSKF